MHFKSGIAALALSAGLTSALPEGSKTTSIVTSTTNTATPTATVPYKDGSLMCRAGNTNVWDYKQGDKHHYMKLDRVHKLVKSFVCKDLTGKYHDAPKDVKKGESFDRAWVENMDEYKNYVYGLKWKNNEGCQNSTSIFHDPKVCFDKFTSFTEKCESPSPLSYCICIDLSFLL